MPNARKIAGSIVNATEKVVASAAELALETLAGRDDAPAVPGARHRAWERFASASTP